jgi:hypothetical protein
MMMGMRVLFAAIAICGAVPAWSQDEPKATFPLFREDAGALQCELLRRLPPEVRAQVLAQESKSKCEAPCATWARSQTDFQFSYEVCVTKCRGKDPAGCRSVSQ